MALPTGRISLVLRAFARAVARRGFATLAAILLLVFVAALLARAAPQFGRGFPEGPAASLNPADRTELVFARVKFNSGRGGRSWDMGGWAHDYPVAEHHILELVNRLTRIHVQQQSYAIVNLDSEEIFDYPFLYFSEVGEMNLTPRETVNFREYLGRGGIAMVDDFDSPQNLNWFQNQMRLVFPDRTFTEIGVEHAIFHTGYDLENLEMAGPGAGSQRARFYGYFDDQDRMTMIINHNNDIGDFWEWLDEPMYPLKDTMQGVRLGINYLLYSMTH